MALDTAEFRRLSLLIAGMDASKIPPILDTAMWRRLLLAQLAEGGGVDQLTSPDGTIWQITATNAGTVKLVEVES